MSIAELAKTLETRWRTGRIHPTVVATRARISRNLPERFASLLDDGQRQLLREMLFSRLADSEALAGATYFDLESLPPHERDFLRESALLGSELKEDVHGKGMVVTADPDLTLLVGEEDHLRIHCLLPGLQLDNAFGRADSLDAALEELFDFAFSEEFGYLSVSPRRAGTGLKVSAILHLPALALSEELPRVFRGLGALHLSVEDACGDGPPGGAVLLEFSNARCLGDPETHYLELVEGTVAKLDEFERRARERLLSEARSLLEDHVWTAYGQIRYARLMPSDRALRLLGTLRLGCLTELIQDVTLQELQQVWFRVRDGFLQESQGGELEETERDRRRAGLLRDWLSGDGDRTEERISSDER